MIKNSTIKLPFDPHGNIFRWGPVPGKFLYTSTFVEVHFKHFREKYGENWSETLWLFKDGRSFWINNMPDVQAAGEKVFVRYMLPKEPREKIYQEWKKDTTDLVKMESEIDTTDLKKLANQELLKIWNDFHELCIKFWVTGSVPELANYGSIHYLTERMKKYATNEQDIATALEVLTAPARLSFYQEEEIALFQSADLIKHQQHFFWLKNSYAGTQILSVEFFAKRKKELRQNIEIEVKKKLEETYARKLEIQKQFNLPAEIMDIAEAISEGIGWQDERKKHVFIILHYIDLLAREVERRYGYTFDELHNLWHHEITQIIEGTDLHAKLRERTKGFGVQFFYECKELNTEESEYFWNAYSTEKMVTGADEVKGIIASKGDGGSVRGKIHILLDPMKIETFRGGEILVAPMTSPEYIFAMKKASAVLTDTGGLTSHAAIVSRELGIPCLVGTKIATTFFKDGDLVEVNAEQGIARKINEKAPDTDGTVQGPSSW